MKKVVIFIIFALIFTLSSCADEYYKVDIGVTGYTLNKFDFNYENSNTEKYENLKSDSDVAKAMNFMIKLQSKHNPDYGYIDVSINMGNFMPDREYFADLNYSDIFIFNIADNCNVSLEIKYEDINMEAFRDLSNDDNVVSITIAESLLATE